MFNLSRKFMAEREDGKCPFCGTEVKDFSVCTGCNSDKIYCESPIKVGPLHYVVNPVCFIITLGISLLLFKNFNGIWYAAETLLFNSLGDFLITVFVFGLMVLFPIWTILIGYYFIHAFFWPHPPDVGYWWKKGE